MTSRSQQLVAGITTWLCCFSLTAPTYSQVASTAAEVNIIVTEGQGAINNIRQHSGRPMAVRISDQNQHALSGVPVVFTLPSQGAGGSFLNGDKTLIVNTDVEGIAAARGFKPNNVAGKFEVRVSASYQGRSASAVITQFNMAVRNESRGGKGKWIAILIAAGGAGAAGAVLGTRGSSTPSSPTSPPGPPTIGISPGSGSVGPPQ